MSRLLLIFLGTMLALTGAGQQRPNMVFIAADDLGYGDLSCYGNKAISTPNLDRMAADGIRFLHAYAAAPVCTPSRTGFMTGRYPARTSVGLMEPLDWTSADSLIGLSPETPSVAAQLKKVGYRTGLIGKWHLGFTPRFSPRVNGFDYFFGFHGGGVDYDSHTAPSGEPDLYHNEKAVTRSGYLTDILAEEAVAFIRTNRDYPFFLSVQFSAPHWPWQARGDKAYPVGDGGWKEGGSADKYAAMVGALDDAVGRILQALRDDNLEKNTLVVFTSDNGGERFSDMGGLRERKFVLWEGGIRVPCIAVWPGRIPAGSTSKQPIMHLDWTTTFLSIAGAKPNPAFPPDGSDLASVLADPFLNEPRIFFWRVFQRNRQKAVLSGDWKLLVTEDGEYLFRPFDDPAEQQDLKSLHLQQVEKLKSALAQWEKSVLIPRPLSKRTP
jgi:arylsulfatase A-like enzyme